MKWHMIAALICMAYLICIDAGAGLAMASDYATFYALPIENESPPSRIPPYA